jgi:hypothetical protein
MPRGTVHSSATVGTVPVRLFVLYAPAGMGHMYGEIGTPAPAGSAAPSRTCGDVAKPLAAAPQYPFEIGEPGEA